MLLLEGDDGENGRIAATVFLVMQSTEDLCGGIHLPCMYIVNQNISFNASSLIKIFTCECSAYVRRYVTNCHCPQYKPNFCKSGYCLELQTFILIMKYEFCTALCITVSDLQSFMCVDCVQTMCVSIEMVFIIHLWQVL